MNIFFLLTNKTRNKWLCFPARDLNMCQPAEVQRFLREIQTFPDDEPDFIHTTPSGK